MSNYNGSECIKKDKEGNIITIYSSLLKAAKTDNLQYNTLRRKILKHELYNDYYYEANISTSNYVDVNCEICGQTFKCERFRIDKRAHIFCSKKCEGIFNSGELNRTCEICGKQFHRKPSDLTAKYCSINCHKIAKQYVRRQ